MNVYVEPIIDRIKSMSNDVPYAAKEIKELRENPNINLETYLTNQENIFRIESAINDIEFFLDRVQHLSNCYSIVKSSYQKLVVEPVEKNKEEKETETTLNI